ncbi:MAG: glutamate racemase [Acutalibacteraceae bacterium]|nr:glutamate racemase [Acutalibacteraceae bacterium]
MNDKTDPIAVVDSGMGGITVLRKLHRIMPNENYIYFGDSANSPYGTKTKEEIKNLTVDAVEMLMKRGAKSVVIACNTATSAAAAYLREKYPDYPFVGLEPAIKPAALSGQWPRVLVLATPLTLKEDKFNKLMARFENEAEFIKLPAPELVGFVESCNLDSPEEIEYLEKILAPYSDNRVDAVVLGCTHFPYARRQIQRILGDEVLVFDGSLGAARQCQRLLEARNLINDSASEGTILFENSDESKIEKCKFMFNYKG